MLNLTYCLQQCYQNCQWLQHYPQWCHDTCWWHLIITCMGFIIPSPTTINKQRLRKRNNHLGTVLLKDLRKN